jgi:hypothetical protein
MAVAGVAALAAVSAPPAGAYRTPTSEERVALVAATESFFNGEGGFELTDARIARTWASANIENPPASWGDGSPHLFFEEGGGAWKVINGSDGCVETTELPMPMHIALELQACKPPVPKVFVKFSLTRQFEPRTLYFGNQTIGQVQWHRWGQTVAHGSGVFASDNCQPDCAEGQITDFSVGLWLDDIHSCGGVRFYSRLRFSLAPRAPGPTHQSLSVTCGGRFH